MSSARSKTKAQQALKALQQAGIKEAALVPSFAFSEFKCCFHSLLGGRYVTRREALTQLKKLRDLGFTGYVKRAVGPYRPLPSEAESLSP